MQVHEDVEDVDISIGLSVKRGSFTGATADRPGRLESVGRGGCILLDEIGDVELSIQVKLLRVLQERTFSRVGDAKPRRFEGKIIAATHRDLPTMAHAGQFRADLFYRLAGDVIRTPPLRDLIAGDADELRRLVGLVTHRLLSGRADEAELLAGEIVQAIAVGVGFDHAWPGNFRELEQCVRGVLVRGEYAPLAKGDAARDAAGQLVSRLRAVAMSADEATGAYCRLAYDRLGSYEAVARALKLDRRTVKAKLKADSCNSESVP